MMKETYEDLVTVGFEARQSVLLAAHIPDVETKLDQMESRIGWSVGSFIGWSVFFSRFSPRLPCCSRPPTFCWTDLVQNWSAAIVLLIRQSDPTN